MLLICRAVVASWRIADIRLRNDQRPPGGRGREDAVVPNEVEPWRRYDRGESFHEFQGFIDYVGGAVAPAAFEPIPQPAIGQNRQSLGSSPCGSPAIPPGAGSHDLSARLAVDLIREFRNERLKADRH